MTNDPAMWLLGILFQRKYSEVMHVQGFSSESYPQQTKDRHSEVSEWRTHEMKAARPQHGRMCSQQKTTQGMMCSLSRVHALMCVLTGQQDMKCNLFSSFKCVYEYRRDTYCYHQFYQNDRVVMRRRRKQGGRERRMLWKALGHQGALAHRFAEIKET